MSEQVRIGITGAGGRMGQALALAVGEHDALCLMAAVDHPDAVGIGAPVIPGHAVTVQNSLAERIDDLDVIIDFTRPEGTLALLDACVAAHCGMVIGTTGFDAEGLSRIQAASGQIPVVMAANFSLGVNLLRALVAQAAATLGPDYDIEIVEAHHRHKVDAPSGTALALGEAAAQARERRLDDIAVMSRQGHTGARERGAIGFATVRGGDVVGDHEVLFLGEGERISLGHRASSRATFAHGALRAAQWLHGRAPGQYDMFDVLGISPSH